ncbi:three-helix bundle dimerization domain-containing protein [Williamsia sp. D3]|uniref:three-helix bundle dimerization domain-containing protein n=1 Tax=Williamsia sp. D3 TaxID=1313067 RepID=UPI0003D30A5C|nr:hypothetical protein [Williamsia sp. D3]ETD31401.1 hypothetical protein W823_20235 [Williamsia sp. D3]
MGTKPDGERRQIAAVAKRLGDSHPKIATADVDRLVQTIYDRFLDARVRDFIPLLVERRAREALLQGPRPPSPPAVAPTTVDFPMVERLEQSTSLGAARYSA